MPFGNTSLGRLEGVLPQTLQAALALEAYANSVGIDVSVREYGGFRSRETQAILHQWGVDSAAQGKPYAVAPAGKSKHELGQAFDVGVVARPNGMSDDDAYKVLADYAPQIGLKAGYYFHTRKDEFHFELASGAIPVPLPMDMPTDIPTTDTLQLPGDPSPSDATGDTTTGDVPSGQVSGSVIAALAVVGILGILWLRSKQ